MPSPAAARTWKGKGEGSLTLSGDVTRSKIRILLGRWTLYAIPGPKFKGTQDLGTDFQYYNWVDQFNTLGLGENVPIVTGSGSNSLKALIPETGEWVVLRVPYPQGFYSRGMDGRIDDPDGGWKGRGIYTTSGADAAWHIEGGPQQSGVLVKFQIRPDPLAN